jgi:peptide chain release factor 2
LNKEATKNDLWSDTNKAQKLLKERAELQSFLDEWGSLKHLEEELETMIQLSEEEQDSSLGSEIEESLQTLKDELQQFHFKLTLSAEHDKQNAILTINPGAGGTESQDWAEMLLRMYLRWAEIRGYKTRLLDVQQGEEAGIKSATVEVSGDYAYGYMKGESGVHRLVRISPFDAGNRRHTSFAAVSLIPEIEDEVEVVIDEKDLKIDTYRASGRGGQHVNVTDSAVRITHLPTNIVVQCQNERSQHKNKASAMKVLRSRLYKLREEKRQAQLQEMHDEKREIAWGSQIRSYIFHPYQMVKDHRTDVETGNVDAVMDGRIDPFVEAYLIIGND